ncbi:uncharacterized protein KY384_005049 [Bacidia gigantensis]|uniref:uncharacterized protein n=1 Tax=Bacidia gigantensis TaxID=2732470 RepID=UPI001D046878|nr:uncharacterized protein KY384_005049 [Bacidia gigantensis]KAG8530546.1 hypothetical protein KY384_005049 [Bacidia gigantensis]
MDRTLLHARAVIEELGDFGHIRSPAKCAARIGQAFSQTLSAITISGDAIMRIPDVERNGRTFSDGCGTCSPDVLAQVWEGYRGARGLKPTILQIRFQGAKGVISLDSRLQGEKLCLRRSMIKFEGSTDTNVEICGASNKPLPMYLNRQVIKILEDLKVPNEPFLRLQAAAVEELRQTTVSPLNASTFFHRNRIGTAARLSFLIKKLFYWGFDFIEDHFLRDTLETAVLVQVREIKYRSRILVGKGWTLYGIMDETGILKENQIYCAAHLDHGIQVLTGNVVITRCPALHPGDIQVVEAIKVPEDNPLYYLHNVVVFSSYGDRDLPSKLSGGDLDGDLYNVIWDPDLYPKQISPPADYPIPEPINIGRPVERGDMTKHFVTFMENDTLGMIATLHQILADQAPTGTLDPTCIKLAGLHSSAVDFSKTGIPVSRMELPKYPKARPDFQAPGPRVVIDKCVGFEASEDPIDTPIETDEMDEANSFGPPRIRYYPSNKVLGKLYRAIDEHKFFAQIQKQSSRVEKQDHSLIERVWQYVSKKAALIEWTHYTDFAKTVKEKSAPSSLRPPSFPRIQIHSANIN